MQMAASASCCSTFQFDFPSAFYSQTIRKKPSAPFHLSTSYSFLSHSTCKISSISRSHHVYPPIVSRLNDPVIDDPTKHNNIPQLQIKTCHYVSSAMLGLVGQIPANTIGNLTQLRILSLRANRLSGSIPSDFSNLKLLRSLYLQNNLFSGKYDSNNGFSGSKLLRSVVKLRWRRQQPGLAHCRNLRRRHRRRHRRPMPRCSPSAAIASANVGVATASAITGCTRYYSWNWRGYSIRYQYFGNNGPALVLVHGFGANSDHWRKNIPVLACSHRVFSIDLIGYGYSDKPNPSDFEANSFYTFETWAAQLNDFCIDVVKDKAFFICNSIGGVVGLQAAVREPEVCTGIILLNLSLRMLHIKKQPWYGRPLIRSFQSLLRNTALGKFFYKSVATPESVRSILCQGGHTLRKGTRYAHNGWHLREALACHCICYHDTSQVTDELVEAILLPGLEPGAADVFLEFICYSGGPLPEELLPQVKCPVLIAWGDKDPWEPIELGRAYDKFDSVEDFIVLPNVGHCPQDEAPHLVNQIVESFVARHATPQVSLSTKATAHGIATVYFMRNTAYSSS
ncbi:unnamed protein product [Camellia sinensis]